MFVHLGLVNTTFCIMRKAFFSLVSLSSFSLLAHADGGDSPDIVGVISAIGSLIFWFFLLKGIFLVYKDRKEESKAKFKMAGISFIITFILAVIILFISELSKVPDKNNEVANIEKEDVKKNNDSYIKAGFSFILSRVKSPSNTSLLASKYGKEVKSMVEEHCHVKLPACINVGYFSIDTPNGFGTLVREGFWVFYRDGNPCHLETGDALDKVAATQNGHLLISALEMNGCGCN